MDKEVKNKHIHGVCLMSFLRTIPGLLFIALAPAMPAFEEEPSPVQAEVGYVSEYIFRGVERAGDSAQIALAFNRENFRGRLWASHPFDQNDARELSLRAAYVWPAADTMLLEASIAHSWFGNISSSGVDDSLEAGFAARFAPLAGFTPSVGLYHDFRFRADTVQMSVARSIPLVNWGAFLELNFFTGWAHGENWRPGSPGPARRDGYGYWGGEVRLPYRIGGHSMIVAGLNYTDSCQRSAANGPFGRRADANLGFSIAVNLDF